MKTISRFILFVVCFAFVFTSCKKEKEPLNISQTINVSLAPNQSYSFSLPAANEVLQVSTQPLHGSAAVQRTASSPDNQFTYIPMNNYSGTDMVVVSNEQGQTQNNHHRGSCGSHHQQDNITYTFNITIAQSTTAMARRKTYPPTICPTF